jgi:hypothetical protein
MSVPNSRGTASSITITLAGAGGTAAAGTANALDVTRRRSVGLPNESIGQDKNRRAPARSQE